MRTGLTGRIRRTLGVVMVLLLVVGVQAQVNTALMMRGDGTLLPTNAPTVLSNALGLGPWATATNITMSDVDGLQGALNGKLATNGVAQSAVLLTNSMTSEKLVIEDDGGRLHFSASQTTDPEIGVVSGAGGGNYMLIGSRNGDGFLQSGKIGGTASVRIEKQGGSLSELKAASLTLSGGGISAINATSTAATNVANVGTLDARYAPKEGFAVFNIPLGGNYTDFELKATTMNYATNGANPSGMVYFYHSPDPGKASIPEQIWSTQPGVFFTDSQYVNGTNAPMNQRTWRKQSSSQSIAAMRANGASVIAGVVVSVMPSGPSAAQINATNPALIWSYCRMTPTGYEEDAGGHSVWHPIQPTWRPQAIVP